MAIVDSFPGRHLIDQTITAIGEADDAMSGAIVVLSDETPLYVGGLDFWDKNVRRKMVRVHGTLRLKKLAPDPKVNAKGEHSTGMTGKDFVIEGATWELA
jgi:hypothetical protein